VPLGGLGEVGMNCMAIEQGDFRLFVDCGITFPDHPFGTDVIRPDFRYLREEPRSRSAIWLTHGHEDHIGAVAYLLREQHMPVYGPPYALKLVRERLAENPPKSEPELLEISPRERYRVGPFEAEPIRVTHSIADATALALRTSAGTIIHTGDFKIDPSPTDREEFDADRFRALGDEGVRLLLSDSTNIDSEGTAGSEADVGDRLYEHIEDARGRVLVALFASNTHRLRAVLDAARRTHRKLCWLGRSVQSHSRVAAESGYLERADDVLITPAQAAMLPRHRVMFAATGSQAEPASALARVAARTHPYIALDPGDTVILSSRIIPGNDRPVSAVIDALLRNGIQVIERRTHREVHVSGHAHRGEQSAMLQLVRPRAFVPVHGTYHHLQRHAELARSLGVREVAVAQNGDVISLDAEALRIVDHTVSGHVHVARGRDVPDEVLADRSRLAEQGALAVSIAIDHHGRVVGSPDVHGRGVLFTNQHAEWLAQLRLTVKRAVRIAVDDGLLGDLEELRESVRRKLMRFTYESLGRRVVCLVLVHVVQA
jgi:ribonuclease J